MLVHSGLTKLSHVPRQVERTLTKYKQKKQIKFDSLSRIKINPPASFIKHPWIVNCWTIFVCNHGLELSFAYDFLKNLQLGLEIHFVCFLKDYIKITLSPKRHLKVTWRLPKGLLIWGRGIVPMLMCAHCVTKCDKLCFYHELLIVMGRGEGLAYSQAIPLHVILFTTSVKVTVLFPTGMCLE